MQQPLISIIVPVYKVEQYLHKTIGSVLAQTYTNWELLLIDDGSPDKSGAICDEYAAKDSRIKVFHKANGGVSSARNMGLENADGEWVCFLDSDDWWEPCFLRNFVESGLEGVDLILQSFIVDDESRDIHTETCLPDRKFDNAHEVVKFLEDYPGVHNGFLWHRLFRLDIINSRNLRFPKGISFAEDGWLFFDYMQSVKHATSTSKVGYHYIKRAGSLTSMGKKHPFEMYRELLRHYAEALLAFPIEEQRLKNEHVNFTRRYCCRLMSGWFIENAFLRLEERDLFLNELKCINKDLHILDCHDRTISQWMMCKFLYIKFNSLRNLLLKYSLFVMKWEQRIQRRFPKKR